MFNWPGLVNKLEPGSFTSGPRWNRSNERARMHTNVVQTSGTDKRMAQTEREKRGTRAQV